jgi:hypothetical protein
MTQSSRRSNLFLLTLFAFLVAPATLWSAVPLVLKNPPVRSPGSPVLIWDIDLKLANALPRNFRATDEPLKGGNGTPPATIGLSGLHASGSGEFTADNLKLLLTRMHGPVTIFDLRQETHVFVNGLPVSWFATRDWANVGRSQTEIEEAEAAWVQSLGPGSEIAVRLGHAVKKGNAESAVPQQVIVKEASIERRSRASRECLGAFSLRSRTWTNMLRNATHVSLEDIVRRQKLLGYGYDVLRPAGPGNWKAPYMEDRIAFVRAFYKYARANPNGRAADLE